jgi:hypothetical protein
MDYNPAVTTTAVARLHSRSQGAASSSTEPEPQSLLSEPTSPALYDSRNDHGWRRVVRNFSPSWFSVTMGTGIVAVLFINIPWKADWLYYLSIVFFILNCSLLLRVHRIYPAIYDLAGDLECDDSGRH